MATPATSSLPPNINNGPKILAVAWIECGVALLFILARMYTRHKLVRKIGWDDWTAVFTMILAMITTVFITLQVHYGVGRHIVYVSDADIIQTFKMTWLSEPFATFSACFGKISIALLLMRLINVNQNAAQRSFLWFIIVTLFAVNVMCLAVTFASCTPVYYLWEGKHNDPHCWNPIIEQNFAYAQAAYSALCDVLLAIFPIFIVWKLQMELKMKIGLAFLMSFGIFAAAAAVVKTVMLRTLTKPDFTWASTDLNYWVMTENYVIIVVACVPTLRPLFSRKFGLGGSASGKASGNSDNSWKSKSSAPRSPNWLKTITVGGTVYEDEERIRLGNDDGVEMMGADRVETGK